MKYQQSKQRLFELLQAGHVVTVQWTCGGDESLLDISIDGKELLAATYKEGDLAYDLEQLVMDELELPGVGEFSMTGGGQFFLENRSVGLDYQSAAEVYDDELPDDFYDGFTDAQLAEMGLERPAPKDETAAAEEPAAPQPEPADEEDDWMGEEYTGRTILFELPD